MAGEYKKSGATLMFLWAVSELLRWHGGEAAALFARVLAGMHQCGNGCTCGAARVLNGSHGAIAAQSMEITFHLSVLSTVEICDCSSSLRKKQIVRVIALFLKEKIECVGGLAVPAE